MIISFADDSTARVLRTDAEANTYCEGIDVEEGVFTFLDESGQVLRPVFTVPNDRKKFWFISTVSSGIFRLERTEERRPDLVARLTAGEISLDQGPTEIQSLDDLKRSVPSLFAGTSKTEPNQAPEPTAPSGRGSS